MNAGMMDRRVTVEQYTVSRDAWNHPTKTWATLADVWASKKDVVEVERTESDQRVAYTKTVWKIRHRTDVDATMRIKDGSRYYYVIGVKELGRREGLQITTELRE